MSKKGIISETYHTEMMQEFYIIQTEHTEIKASTQNKLTSWE